MRNTGKIRDKQFPIFSLILLFIGICGVLFFSTFDIFKGGTPNFGTNQLAGLVISIIIALAGLRKIALPKKGLLDGILLLAYLSGIFFMGLKPKSYYLTKSAGILQDVYFSFFDVTINILGFIPLGYLMISYFLPKIPNHKKNLAIFLVLATGICISLIIEILQHFIGRSSNVIDVFSNGLGMVLGISFYLLEKNSTSVNFLHHREHGDRREKS